MCLPSLWFQKKLEKWITEYNPPKEVKGKGNVDDGADDEEDKGR